MDDVAPTCFPLQVFPMRFLNNKMYITTTLAKTATELLAMMMDVEDIMCFSFRIAPEKYVQEEVVRHHVWKWVSELA